MPDIPDQPLWPPNHKPQIIGEAIYLVVLLAVASCVTLLLHLGTIPVHLSTRVYLYAGLGGLLGGWAFTTKWFYRAFARLRHSQDDLPEELIERIGQFLKEDPYIKDISDDRKREAERDRILSRIRWHKDRWQPRRLFWRLFTPFVASLVAFAVYLAGRSEAVFLTIEDTSGAFAFSFCFILGYFSDAVVSKMANWVESILGG